MTVIDFMAEQPFSAKLIIYILTRFITRPWIRLMRHLNIRKHGWPTAHLDVDGDFAKRAESD